MADSKTLFLDNKAAQEETPMVDEDDLFDELDNSIYSFSIIM